MNKNTAIIIQARAESSRLPQKMLMPFYGKETLLDVVVSSLVSFFGSANVIVATSQNPADDRIEGAALKHGLRVFRGNEHNVLDRFIKAAEKYKVDLIIRVCADNPFIQMEYIEDLIHSYNNKPADYISFFTEDGIPSIKTHFGFFAELVTLKALKKIAIRTSEKIFLEHVTNYIYTHPDEFKIHSLNIPSELRGRKDIRLTVDSQMDFETGAEIFRELKEKGNRVSISEILFILDRNKQLLNKMSAEITKNEK